MKHTWADPKKEWEGFRLTSYSLDPKKVLDLPLTRKRHIDGNVEQMATTVGEIYRLFAVDRRVEIMDSISGTEVTIDSEKASFAGPSFNQSMLNELLKLRNEGFDPFFAEWFFYDDDSSREDPHDLYIFFVVCGERIVRERIAFSDYGGSGFDPSVFQTEDDSAPLWVNDDAWREARIRFWYQKFYAETRMGQFMVLRDDKPRLYGQSHRGPELSAHFSENALKIFNKIHSLLWVLIVLVALVLIRLWR